MTCQRVCLRTGLVKAKRAALHAVRRRLGAWAVSPMKRTIRLRCCGGSVGVSNLFRRCVPASTWAPKPGAQGQSAGASLKQSVLGGEGGVEIAAERLEVRSANACWGKGGRANPKISWGEAGAEPGYAEIRRLPRSFPGSPAALRLPPAAGPGAAPTQHHGRAPSWKQDWGTRVSSRALGSIAPPPSAAENVKDPRNLKPQNPPESLLLNLIFIWLAHLRDLTFPEFSFKSVSLLPHASSGIGWGEGARARGGMRRGVVTRDLGDGS